MKKQFIIEAKRMQKLAGIVTESQLGEAYTFPEPSEGEINRLIQRYKNEAADLGIDDDVVRQYINRFIQLRRYLKPEESEILRYSLPQLITLVDNSENKITESINENSFGPDSKFQWKSFPAYPEDIVKDEEEGDTMTKEEFWRDNIVGRDPEETIPSYGTKQLDGTWLFSWDAGEFSGFIEGDDFML
jgi:hypothetical protein